MVRLAFNPTKKFGHARSIIGLVAIVGIGAGLWIWHKHNHKTVSTIPTTTLSGGSSNPSPSPTTSSQSQSQSSSETNAKSAIPTQGTASSTALVAPYGTFVSNHQPSLSGSSSPSQEQSVCTTTAGASCYIEFTQGSTTKKLASQTTDGSGSASWTWDIKQAGLGQGKWTITAIVSMGGQIKSTVDQISLEVEP